MSINNMQDINLGNKKIIRIDNGNKIIYFLILKKE